MRLIYAAVLATLILAGCSNSGGEASGSTPVTPTQGSTTAPPSSASVGNWQGEAGDMRLTLELKGDGTVSWVEETPEPSKKTWTGKWRDEGEELYLLLNSPSNRNALFEKKGDTWIEKTIDGKDAMKDAELILRKI